MNGNTSSMKPSDIPQPTVLVAGAGPVGLCIAAGLARQGVRTTVLERLPDLSSEARASTFHPPTLEFFAELGVLDEVLRLGRKVERLQFWERAARKLVAEFNYKSIAQDTPYPFRLQCPQSVVTRVLKPALESTGMGKVLFSHQVLGVEPRPDDVVVHVDTPTGKTTFTAPYVVAADGARSAIRTSLDLGFSGKTYEDRFLLVATDLDVERFFPSMGPVGYVFDPEEWVIVMHLPDVVRVVFRLAPGDQEEEAKTESNVRQRMARFLGTEVPFTLKSASVYSVHQRVADTFRVGRVLLAGDAAHINNPTGGMGMNSGIHDAQLLVKSLLEVLRGGSDTCLDDYAALRRKVAVEGVQRDADRNYRALTATTQKEREARDEELVQAATDHEAARAFLLRASMMENRIASPSIG